MSPHETLIRQILLRAEALYEQFGNPLVVSHPRRRGWAFARALGATRLAGELGARREDIVAARRKAFSRWRYWYFRYEQPLWREIAALSPDRQEWEGLFARYLRARAGIRRGAIVATTSQPRAAHLLACALRSVGTVPWLVADAPQWQAVWRHLHQGEVSHAQALADRLGWTTAQWRRARGAVRRLHCLVWLPLSQRRLLALRGWPAEHLQALARTGRALFPACQVSLLDLLALSPRQIARFSADAVPRLHTVHARQQRQGAHRSVPAETVSWRVVCDLYRRGQRRKAQAQLAILGSSTRHARRLRQLAGRLTTLFQLPLSQRQFLALSRWPDARLGELRVYGRTQIGGHAITTARLRRLTPAQLTTLRASEESQAAGGEPL
jgi:hypothetical protein